MITNSKPPEEWTHTSVRLPRTDLHALKVIAAKGDRSVSAEVRRLIQQHISASADELKEAA